MKYNATITDHFDRPRNMGAMADATCMGEAENAVCLDRVRIYLRIERNTVVRASFQAQGCVPAIAAASIVTEYLTGLPMGKASDMTSDRVEELVGGLPSTKKHAAHVVAEALVRALESAPVRE